MVGALPPPDLHIPASTSTVKVSIIDTTASIRGVDAWKFLHPSLPGHSFLAAPAFSFLVQHPTSQRAVVFDLGIRKDWWNSSPFLQDHFRNGGYQISVEHNVADILSMHGVSPASIEAVIWSHWHFDHTGDPSTFPPTTALIVGPGFKDALLPGYPTNPNSSLLESDYAGRELREITFPPTHGDGADDLKIGRLSAMDYFGDGSFYLLNTPGHAIGHLCGLARVTSNPDSFILMGADAAHHGGELRPSPYMPLPDSIAPHPFTDSVTVPWCPGAEIETLLTTSASGGDRTQPFYRPASQTTVRIHADVDEAVRTIGKLQEADVRDDVFVVLAHDEFMLDVVDFFPKTANNFMEKGWAKECRWKFLKDFAQVVGWQGDVAKKRDWSRPAENEAEQA